MRPACRNGRIALLAGVLAMIAALLLLAPQLTNSAELVRMRNALLLQDAAADAGWTPASLPADFMTDSVPADPRFTERVRALLLAAQPDDWSRALVIARHLLENRQDQVGTAIQSDLERTYQVIRASGTGYCGDYADVFAALASAAGIGVRSWAFSFDGFGGNGHIFNEVWDAGSGSWRMIDVFHNYYFTDAQGTVLSAQAFRDAMLRDPQEPRIALIEPRAKLVFKFEDKARDFYRRGLPEWYLWWGNNLFTYDGNPVVRGLATLSRSLEQVGGIVAGVQPRLRVLAEPGNAAQREAMVSLRVRMFLALALGVAGFILTFVALIRMRACRRRTT